MDKGRAIITYVMTQRRVKAGSPELFEPKHIIKEAEKIIEENNCWEEVFKAVEEDDNICREKIKKTEKEFYSFLLSGEKNEKKEQEYIDIFNSYNVNGEIEEIIRYRASHNNKYPEEKELQVIMSNRKKEDLKNARLFVDLYSAIALGGKFKKKDLIEVTKRVISHGLFKRLVVQVPKFISYKKLKSLGGDIKISDPFIY